MPIITTANFVQGKDMLTLDHQTQLYVSALVPFTTQTPPQFGQVVTLRGAVAVGDEQISVRSLVEAIPAGTTLRFGTDEVKTLNLARQGNGSIFIEPSTVALTIGRTATTSGMQQTVVLANPVMRNDDEITVESLSNDLEQDRILDFGSRGQLKVIREAKRGSTVISIEPSIWEIPSATGARIPNFEQVYSINQADDSTESNVLQDRNFSSGPWTSKKVTSRSSSISCSGFYILNDFGLKRVLRAGRQISKFIYFILIEPAGGQQYKGYAHVGTSGNNRQVDSNKQVNFNLEVDGELYEANYPYPEI